MGGLPCGGLQDELLGEAMTHERFPIGGLTAFGRSREEMEQHGLN